MPAASDKRRRLTRAARQLIHRQGYNQTSLADIANAAEVPLGNVYYYFKTKEAIGEALIAEQEGDLRRLLAAWEEHPDPKKRLLALIEHTVASRRTLARYGCPIGSLCQELDKAPGPLADKSATLLRLLIDWSEAQFRLLGRADAPALALHLLAALQGASLITNTFRQPRLMLQQARQLEAWLDTL